MSYVRKDILKYETIKNYKDEELQKLGGVKKSTFQKMIAILKETESQKKAKRGKPNVLAMEEKLLKALKYLKSIEHNFMWLLYM